MKRILYFQYVIFVLLLFSCGKHKESKIEIVQRNRDKIINVSDRITSINPEILFGSSLFYIIDNVLIVDEISPKGMKGIHLFDKNKFNYLLSTGFIGKGPGEITRSGRLGINEGSRIIWVPDYGKNIMYKFPLDSVLNNSTFKPKISIKINPKFFMERFSFLNDTIAIGQAWTITSNSSFETHMSKLDLRNNRLTRFGYEHPEITGKKSNSVFAMSYENNFYVNCYYYCDLVTICDLNGNCKCNVYGPGWHINNREKNSYFLDVDLYSNYIIASYIGSKGLVVKGNIKRGAAPTRFIVFDSSGNYIKTIETGFEFERFCVDKDNKRIIAYFIDREEPMGYFDISFLDRN